MTKDYNKQNLKDKDGRCTTNIFQGFSCLISTKLSKSRGRKNESGTWKSRSIIRAIYTTGKLFTVV